MDGGLGQDTLKGDNDDDRLDGGAGNDTLEGAIGQDTLFGGARNDILTGGLDKDAMTGGAGNDLYSVDNTGDTVTEAAGGGTADSIVTTLFSYTLVTVANVENLQGNASTGQILAGSAGNNIIQAGAGADTLNGLAGNDTLTGGAGADRFVFGVGSGQDRVTLFADGSDKVDLIGGLTFAQLTETAISGGVRLAITAAPATFIALIGVTTAQVAATDFV